MTSLLTRCQLTCLFWFETTDTLRKAEDWTPNSSPIQRLARDAIPTGGFLKWVLTILSTTQVTPNVILLALLFIYRLKTLNPTVKGKAGSEYRLLTVALMLGNKCEYLEGRHEIPRANNFSSRRQHLYEQDLGRGIWHLSGRDPCHGSRIPEQYAVQPLGFQGAMGRMADEAGKICGLLRPSVENTSAAIARWQQLPTSFPSVTVIDTITLTGFVGNSSEFSFV